MLFGNSMLSGISVLSGTSVLFFFFFFGNSMDPNLSGETTRGETTREGE